MGIPGLFSSCINNYHKTTQSNDVEYKIVKPELTDKSKPTHLYLDFNAGIYQVIKPDIKTPETLILRVLDYLDLIVSIPGNVELLYIAFDGVPPRAKIEQQRARRFHSVCKKTKMEEINTKYGNEFDRTEINTTLDTNMITPGTKFMHQLATAIRNHISSTPAKYNNITVLFSDTSEPGEGEHKIIRHIKSSHKFNPNLDVNTVIYGLDGDLIMLALSTHVNNITLLREANEYGKYGAEYGADSTHTSDIARKFLFMDITNLTVALVQHFRLYLGRDDAIRPTQIDNYIDDYIVLCFLLGNDFMPKIPWYSIQYGGYEALLSAYFQVHNHDEEFLVNTEQMQINTPMLYNIMIILSGGEQPVVEAYFKKRATMKPPLHNPRNGGHIKYRDGRLTERQKQQIITDHLPLQYLNIEAEIDPFEINRSHHNINKLSSSSSTSISTNNTTTNNTTTHGLSIHDIRTHIARANLDDISLLDCHDSTNIPQKSEELSRVRNFAEINDSNIAPDNNINILGNHINTSNYNNNLLGYHKWFDRYYKIALNIDISNNENIEQITDAYLRTLVWNFRYYFTDVCPNWDWYYPYNYPPVVFHIFKAVERIRNINNIKFLGSKPIEPQMLLIMVLPPESMELLAIDIRNKLMVANNSLAVYFPAKYSISVLFHKYYHECPPNILRMDIKRVVDFYKSCRLTDEEKKRN